MIILAFKRWFLNKETTFLFCFPANNLVCGRIKTGEPGSEPCRLGIPVDDMVLKATEDLRAQLGLDDFGSAVNTFRHKAG